MRHSLFRAVVVLSLLAGPIPAGASVAASASDEDFRGKQWHLDYFQIDEAHKLSRGAGIVVALLDTGVAAHPDLDGSVLPGTDFGPLKTDGRQDGFGHGTKMAGFIAAHGRLVGMAPEAKILPVKLRFTDDSGGVADTEEPVRWAVDHGAKVISLSVGGDDPHPAWARAIAYALSKDVVVVAAVNNAGRGTKPSGLASVPGVIAVSGVDQQGEFDPISLSGKEVVVAAPARDGWTTRNDGGRGPSSGTSISAAIVSGAVALIRARFPQLRQREVVDLLTSTADDRGAPGRDELYGYGVINPLRALQQGPSGRAQAPAPAPAGGAWVLAVVAVAALLAAGFLVVWVRRRSHTR